MIETEELLQAMAELESRGYRLLRPLKPFDEMERQLGREPLGDLPIHHGCYLDVEGTGTDADADKITELAIVRFSFTGAGDLIAIEDGYAGFNDPGIPIPEEVTALTGITDEMVKGQSLSMAAVLRCMADVSLVIAHSAQYDRRMVERLWGGEVFTRRQMWGCSVEDIDWRAHGFKCAKLPHLVQDVIGCTYTAHRAADDVGAALYLLSCIKPLGEHDEAVGTWFGELIASVRRPTMRVWATGSHYSTKDVLKQRGYRWDGERRKCWYINKTHDNFEAELAWLFSKLHVTGEVQKVSAYDRYSVRDR